MNGSRQRNAVSADEATQGGEAQRDFTWVEASVWTERMLSALGNGVKGGASAAPTINAGQMPSSRKPGCSRFTRPGYPARQSR